MIELEHSVLIEKIKQLQHDVDQILVSKTEKLGYEQGVRQDLNEYLRLQDALIQDLKFDFNRDVVALRQELAASRHDYRSLLKRSRADLISSY